VKKANELLHYVQAFFQSHLAAKRGVSPNTVLAYRDAIKLFLSFAARQAGKRPVLVRLEDLQPETVLAFLDEIETARGNKVVTRNLRLSALRTFFGYLAAQDTLRAGQYQKIVAIPLKRTSHPLIGYLEVAEMNAVLEAIDRSRGRGQRDYALLSFMYNTGARVQETSDMTVGALRLVPTLIATITGKGGKTRQVPLWPQTAELLREHLSERKVIHDPGAPLFVNAHGQPLTRFGIHHILRTRVRAAHERCPSLRARRVSPHTLRHTTAMHLLQSGVDLTVIKSWLGHVNLATTHGYVEIDLEMKRKALAACSPPDTAPTLQRLIDQNQDVISWLESL
jgi:integrase/recombinase XerD